MVKIKEGADVTITAIQKKMIPAISLPLPEECPTGLRYALAKYAATAVSEAWEGLVEMAEAGLLVDANVE